MIPRPQEPGFGDAARDADARRIHGRYYTPAWLADEIVGAAFAAAGSPPKTILDPACGDGQFLVAAMCRLIGTTASNWRTRFAVARDRLFGVDNDADALALARLRLFDQIDPPRAASDDVRASLEQNLRHGDALLGPDFQETSRDTHRDSQRTRVDAAFDPDAASACDASAAPALDWRSAFPRVAAAGGFELIVGNPPYRRELNARAQFDRLARTPLGRKWRQPRMDLWHYFVHRGLDLLQARGRLAFVVSSYWLTAHSARRLIARLRSETTFEELRLLGDAPIFDGVEGRHMTFRLRKETTDDDCLIRDGDDARIASPRELFSGDRIVLAPPRRRSTLGGQPLGDRFRVRQGIAENPPTITRAHVRRHPGHFQLGEGVFVLTRAEFDARRWNAAERELLRPYVEPWRIERWGVAPGPERWLFYLTRHTAPSLDGLPNLAAHLERFRPLLDARREVRNGAIAWWHLHWPRDERLFVEPRLLAPQMVRTPTFCAATAPTFVGFSVNLVAPESTDVAKRKHEGDDITARTQAGDEALDRATELHALAAILNSTPAAEWFQTHAKRRGVNLDIGGTVLREFPLPDWRPESVRRLAELSRSRHAARTLRRQETTDAGAGADKELDTLVRDAYAAPHDE